eukprot:scaffold7832_cov267-Pinguiococcus_pyrenoidosus.AAC.3
MATLTSALLGCKAAPKQLDATASQESSISLPSSPTGLASLQAGERPPCVCEKGMDIQLKHLMERPTSLSCSSSRPPPKLLSTSTGGLKDLIPPESDSDRIGAMLWR